MEDISGYGLKVIVSAIPTFPQGITITQFADDADPFDLPSIQIADKAMGLNGDLIIWAKAVPIALTLSVIAGSKDDQNLRVLFQTSRPGKGKPAVHTRFNIVGVYPNGKRIALVNGVMTDGMPGLSVASAGRMKSKSYVFTFENSAAT
jgi:hypothetical protein